MAYSAITFGQLKTAVSGRLGDPTRQFWTGVELGRLIVEALRTLNAFTRQWTGRGVLAPRVGTTFYDVAVELPTLCGRTVTDLDLLLMLENNLLEPESAGGAWAGSEQFTYTDLVAALQRRRDQWLLETGQVLTELNINGPGPQTTRLALPGTLMEVRRVGWISHTSKESPLNREDGWQKQAYARSTRDVASLPVGYSLGPVPPLQMDVLPAPREAGRLRLLGVEAGAVLNTNPASAAVLLGIPDDWAWAIRFGALADLLNQSGPAQDVPRSTHCQKRWEQAVAAAKGQGLVLGADLGGVPVHVASVLEADAFQPGWMNTPGQPSTALTCGGNLFAWAPVPDERFNRAPYGGAVDVVRNAPIPSVDGDYLDLASEAVEAVEGYVVHLASFKMGGDDFEATTGLMNDFLRFCGVKVAHVKAEQPSRDQFDATVQRDEAMVERERVGR